MTPADWAVWVLLPLGVVVILASVVGVMAMPNLFDRLHFLGPASGVGPLLVAGAVVARESLDHEGIEALLIAGVLVAFGPVLSHAVARAARIREHGNWTIRPDEKVKGP